MPRAASSRERSRPSRLTLSTMITRGNAHRGVADGDDRVAAPQAGLVGHVEQGHGDDHGGGEHGGEGKGCRDRYAT